MSLQVRLDVEDGQLRLLGYTQQLAQRRIRGDVMLRAQLALINILVDVARGGLPDVSALAHMANAFFSALPGAVPALPGSLRCRCCRPCRPRRRCPVRPRLASAPPRPRSVRWRLARMRRHPTVAPGRSHHHRSGRAAAWRVAKRWACPRATPPRCLKPMQRRPPPPKRFTFWWRRLPRERRTQPAR